MMIQNNYTMKIAVEQLQKQLQSDLQLIMNQVETEFLPLSTTALNWKPQPDAWSIAECVEHLNLYARFYVPAIAQAICNAPTHARHEFRSGWLGEQFVKTVSPANVKRQKTFRRMTPAQSQLSLDVLQEFLQHQAELLQSLTQAQTVDWNKTRVPVEFWSWLKMNLGDAFRFVIAHEQRHLQQAQRVAQAQHLQAVAVGSL
jgi:hypothetical protein